MCWCFTEFGTRCTQESCKYVLNAWGPYTTILSFYSSITKSSEQWKQSGMMSTLVELYIMPAAPRTDPEVGQPEGP